MASIRRLNAGSWDVCRSIGGEALYRERQQRRGRCQAEPPARGVAPFAFELGFVATPWESSRPSVECTVRRVARRDGYSVRSLQRHCHRPPHVTADHKDLQAVSRTRLPYFTDGEPTFVCHDLNQRHHSVVISSYVKSLRKYGLTQDVRGIACAVPSPGNKAPYRMLTFGSVTRAVYIAAEKYGDEELIKKTLEIGLFVDIYDEAMPSDAARFIRDYFNSFHKGAAVSFLEILNSTLPRDAEWKAYACRHGIPLSRGGRGANATDKHLEKWLNEHHEGLYKSMNTYHSAKAFMNTLSANKWVEDWSTMLGDIVDFSNKNIETNNVMLNMHSWLLCVMKTKFVIEPNDMKLLFLSGCKFMVPVAEDGDDVESSWLFEKVSKDRIEIVCTPMDESVVYKPKAKPKAKSKTAEKEESEVKPKSKAAGKAKAKKQKTKGLSMPEETLVSQVHGVNLSGSEGGSDGDDGDDGDDFRDDNVIERPKLWIEDLVSAIDSVLVGLRMKCAEPHPETEQRVKETCYHIGLFFAWTQSVTLHGGTEFTKWSGLRDALKDIVLQSQQATVARHPGNGSGDDVAQIVLRSLSRVSKGTGTESLAEKLEVAAKENLTGIVAFLKENPLNVPVTLHPACRNLVPKAWARWSELTLAEKDDFAKFMSLVFSVMTTALPTAWFSLALDVGNLHASGKADDLPADARRVLPTQKVTTEFVKLRCKYVLATLRELAGVQRGDAHRILKACVAAWVDRSLEELADSIFLLDFQLLKPDAWATSWASVLENFANELLETDSQPAMAKKDVFCRIINGAADKLKRPAKAIARPPLQEIVPSACAGPADDRHAVVPVVALKYTVEDLYCFTTVPRNLEGAVATLLAKADKFKEQGILFEIPTQALSTPLMKMLCHHLETALYTEYFKNFADTGDFGKIIINVCSKEAVTFTFDSTVKSTASFAFAGEVSTTRAKPGLLLGAVIAGTHLIPLCVNGAKFKSLSSEPCFVFPWLVPVAAPEAATMVHTWKPFACKLSLAVTGGSSIGDSVDLEPRIALHSLEFKPQFLGKSKVPLVRPEFLADVVLVGGKDAVDVNKCLGAAPALSKLAEAAGPAAVDAAAPAFGKPKVRGVSTAHLLK